MQIEFFDLKERIKGTRMLLYKLSGLLKLNNCELLREEMFDKSGWIGSNIHIIWTGSNKYSKKTGFIEII